MEENRVKKQTDTYIYGPMTFNRDAKALDGKRIVFATNDAKQLNF